MINVSLKVIELDNTDRILKNREVPTVWCKTLMAENFDKTALGKFRRVKNLQM